MFHGTHREWCSWGTPSVRQETSSYRFFISVQCVYLYHHSTEQFLDMNECSVHFSLIGIDGIQQKVSKGIDPPQALTADMMPPSERGTPVPVGLSCTHAYKIWFLLTFNLHIKENKTNIR